MAKLTLKTSELREGQPTRVDLEGKGVLVAKVGQVFYAIGDRCTHLGCSLSKGTLEATTLPVVISNFEPWQGQVMIVASSVPLLSEHPRWVHLSPIA